MHAFLSTALILILLGGAGVVFSMRGEPVYWPGFGFMMAFYGAIFYVGARAGQRTADEDPSQMLLAGRSLPLWMAIFTMSATWVGGGYINGTAEFTASSGLVWVQAPWAYALSLVLGGLFFAGKMRRHRFTTMLDPFCDRFGPRIGAVMFVPALLGELFWTAAILTALGTTFGTILGIDVTASILLSAAIAIAYTVLGGMWAVAMTDVVQLTLLMAGLWLVVAAAGDSTGGWEALWTAYAAEKGEMARLIPPWDGWLPNKWGPRFWNWWDSALLLVFGGIPWHVYFQRVLSAKTPRVAQGLSLTAGVVCLAAAVPAVLIGMISATTPWESLQVPAPETAALTLPHVFRYLTPPLVASIGLGALSAAVMSSVDSSILSSSSMATWNVYRPLVHPQASATALNRIIKVCVVTIGGLATWIALEIQSVYKLWVLCSDFVYCILFPQLVAVLFDKKANALGSVAGFAVAFFLRVGGGEPVLGLPQWIPYPMTLDDGTVLFPFRTLAMVTSLATIFTVSRLTGRWSSPQPLRPVPNNTDQAPDGEEPHASKAV